jgi:hypothetical protein
MCRGLTHIRAFDLAYPLCDDTKLIFARRFFDFFVVVVVQNSFPNSPMLHNHCSRCYTPVWGSCANYHCNEVALELCLTLEFYFVAQACENVRPLTC